MSRTSLAKDLWDRSKWFLRAKDEDAPPRRRQIAERLRDLSEYVGNLATDDDGGSNIGIALSASSRHRCGPAGRSSSTSTSGKRSPTRPLPTRPSKRSLGCAPRT